MKFYTCTHLFSKLLHKKHSLARPAIIKPTNRFLKNSTFFFLYSFSKWPAARKLLLFFLVQLFTKSPGHCQSCQQRCYQQSRAPPEAALFPSVRSTMPWRGAWWQVRHLPPCLCVPMSSTYPLLPWESTHGWGCLTAEIPAWEQLMPAVRQLRWAGGCLARLVVPGEGTWW